MEKIMYPASKILFTDDIPGIDKKILDTSFIFHFKNGEFIAKEMTNLNYLYFIIEGRAKIVTTQENGKRLILQFLHSTDLIGDLTIVHAEEYTKDVVSVGNTICLGIPIQVVNEKLLNQNDFLFYLANYIGKKLQLRVNHFKEQQTQELKIRLAKLFLEISVDGIYHEKHTEISEYLGVSYRHFMHTFKFFKEGEYIKKEQNYYLINEEKLQNFL